MPDTKRPIRVLHLEDSPRDAELIQALLENDGFSCEILVVDRREGFETALTEGRFDVILCDYSVPAYDGITALKLAQEKRPATPVIMVSGSLSEEEAVTCLHLGAADYLLKQRLGRLGSAVRRALQEAEKQNQLQQAEATLRASEELLRQLAGNIPEIFWVRDVEGQTFHYVSPAWETISGRRIAPGESLPRLFEIVHPDDIERVELDARTRPRGGVDHQYRIVRPDGAVRWLHVRTFPILNPQGDVYRVAGVGEDITEQKAAEDRLLKIARYDSLTNLPNRAFFYDTLKRALVPAEEGYRTIAVLFVDLDRFKNVNDTLGHAVGDELLRQVAERLLNSVRIRDVVGRLGGDEFALILTDLENPDDAGTVAAKIIDALSQPFLLDHRETFVTASIGITVSPGDSSDADTLLRYADTAMYRAKEQGRNTLRFYTAEMNARALERLDLETALRRALERGEFLLHYQPKVELGSRRVSGFEALLRWQRPGAGLVSPMEFIPLLEETGMIVQVGEWVIQAACRQIRDWRDAGVGAVKVAVNLSGRQFFQKDLNSTILRIVEQSGIEPELLGFEITESSLMSQAGETVAILDAMKARGFHLAVDDFGTGYSSLSYLKRFPIDTVKIDHTFVRDIPADADDAAMVEAIIRMAHTLKLSVVAEGVETAEQLEFLRSLDCDEVQGYYLGRPMDSEAAATFLRETP